MPSRSRRLQPAYCTSLRRAEAAGQILRREARFVCGGSRNERALPGNHGDLWASRTEAPHHLSNALTTCCVCECTCRPQWR